jgi:hypothetical protein
LESRDTVLKLISRSIMARDAALGWLELTADSRTAFMTIAQD